MVQYYPGPPPLTGRDVTTTPATRVLLVDDHAAVREGLKALFALVPDVEIAAEAGSAAEALELLAEASFDLLLVDLVLKNGPDGVQLTKACRASYPSMTVLMLSGHEESLFAERAMAAGALGYVMKDEPFQVLLEAVHRVREGKVWLSDEMREQLVPPTPRLAGTALQVRLARALRAGHRTTADLASASDANGLQAELALQALQERLGVSSRASLFLWLDTGGEVVPA